VVSDSREPRRPVLTLDDLALPVTRRPERLNALTAAELAIALINGETPDAPDSVNNGTKDVPSVFEEPVAVTKDNISEYLGEPDFPKKEDICAGKLAAKCDELGL